MNGSHAQRIGIPAEWLVARGSRRRGPTFGQAASAALTVRGKAVECDVVVALEERIWRDRREIGMPVTSPSRSAAGRLRGRIRDFVARMQLGPVADEAAGRDPETRF
jgi:hypothetical protein